MNIEGRLRKLEKELNRRRTPRLICLFGDDELPAGTPSNTAIFRFDEARRAETVLPAHIMVVRLPEEDRGA